MKRPIIVFSSTVLVLAFGLALALGSSLARSKAQSSTHTTTVPDAKQNTPPPPDITYHFMFRHVVWTQAKAAELESKGQDGSSFRNKYKTFALLSDRENNQLNRVASETINKVKDIDERAKVLILAARAERKALGENAPPPALSPELRALESERKATILAGADHLRNAFGADRFAQFETTIKKQIGAQIVDVFHNKNDRPANFKNDQPMFFDEAKKKGIGQ
jgi:hypothetical protein